uniref:BACON domain-containing protein n=1 Tax=Candidatus Cryptobacteroides bacterium TaxID=3085639 RepID=UPI0040265839
MMRKLLTFLQAVAISTLIAGCGGTGTETGPEITPEIKFTEDIVTSGISVESAEQSVTLSFSTNVAWSATVSADWLTISPSSGEAGKNSVKVEVEENRTGQPRSATITISDKESMQKVSVTVRQEALKASLTVSPESLEFSANKGEEMLNVTSNTDWVITKDAEWITLDSDKGKGLATIAAGVTENTSLTSRTGSITVSTSDGSVKKTVSVRQSGAAVVFSVDKNEHSVAAAGGDFTVIVTRNIGYKINSQPDWVKQTGK